MDFLFTRIQYRRVCNFIGRIIFEVTGYTQYPWESRTGACQ